MCDNIKMIFSQLARLYRVWVAQWTRPGLVEWGSQNAFWLRTAKRSCTILFSLLLLLSHQSSAQVPSLDVNTSTSTDGYYVLSWDGVAGSSQQTTEFSLEESSDESFSESQVVYSGPDKSRVMSGRPNGVYFYRVSLTATPQLSSDTISVEVAHHSIQRALFFFVLGFIVFGSILFTVLRGAAKEDEASN